MLPRGFNAPSNTSSRRAAIKRPASTRRSFIMKLKVSGGVPEGSYLAKFVKVEPTTNNLGDCLKWTWQITSGPCAGQTPSCISGTQEKKTHVKAQVNRRRQSRSRSDTIITAHEPCLAIDSRDFARLLAVALAKAFIRAKSKVRPKHASGNLFRKGRMASANAGDKRMTASGVAMRLATMGCGLFCCSK